MPTLALALILGGAVAAVAAGLPAPCAAVPAVAGIDQRASAPADWGTCTAAVESRILGTSNWWARRGARRG